MKSIWIIRHGYREDYDNKNYANENVDRPNDPGLTVHGKQQAQETSEFIAKEHAAITTVFSSPFLRTLQTSQAIADKINAKIVIEEGLREWINGDVFAHKPKTLTVDELRKVSDRVDLSYNSLYHPSYPENGQVFMDRCDKVMKILVDEMSKTNQTEIALVTHASTLVALTRALSKKGEIRCGLCSVIKLEESSDGWNLKHFGSTSHLSKGEQDPNTDLPYEYWKPIN